MYDLVCRCVCVSLHLDTYLSQALGDHCGGSHCCGVGGEGVDLLGGEAGSRVGREGKFRF